MTKKGPVDCRVGLLVDADRKLTIKRCKCRFKIDQGVPLLC